jgi:DnaK suppressor protein
MTKARLKTLRAALEEKQAELGNGNLSREALVVEALSDEMDRIQHATDRESAIDRVERNFARLGEVQMALQRIDAGNYGVCIECEKEISPKRLAALPWAALCIACQETLDREQKMSQKISWNEGGAPLLAMG